MKGEGEGQNGGSDLSPEIRVVPHVRVNDGVQDLDPESSTILGSVSHYTGSDDDDDYDDDSIFHKFTPKSYQRLLVMALEEKRKEEDKKNRVQEGRLVDGELKFDDGEDAEEDKQRDPSLMEGGPLPNSLANEIPKELLSKPLEEIDPNIKDKTFVIISKRVKEKYIYRFSATKSLFIFAPWNPWRRAMLTIATNQFFDYFIIATILLNMAFLAMDQDANPWLNTAEYVFTFIYTLEMFIKVKARGFFVHKYTYLRDPWNWIDFTVIISAFVIIILEEIQVAGDFGSITALRSFRVLRALKTVSVVPGLKLIISALIRSMKMLVEVVILKLFCMMVFALFALQVYVGVLRQKCVKDIPEDVVVTDSFYMEYVKDSSNWYSDGDYIICGNASGAGACPANYSCLPDIGENPNWGYTTFDNFGWAMLNAFQLITLDYWENLYDMTIRASGPWNIIFFIVVVFFGSFYLVNMMLAVVNMSYEEEVSNSKKEKERNKMDEKESKRRKKAARRARTLKDKKNKDDKSKSDTNHLQVMSAVNGSHTASSASLKSVGNGVIRNGSNSNLREDARLSNATVTSGNIRDEAKTVDTSNQGTGGGEKEKPNQSDSGSSSSAGKTISKEKLLSGLKTKKSRKSLEGHDNPAIITDDGRDEDEEDDASLDSEETNGDPPVIIVQENEDELIDRNCECCGLCCHHMIPWLKFQNALNRVVSDFIFEMVIAICIGLNVLFMAMESHGMSNELILTLRISNYIFTAIFTLEAILKLLALSKQYFSSGWNIFDLIIVVASLIDLGVENVDGLSVFRSFRLLRVFKLAQTWSTLRILLAIIMSTLGALGNLTFVLFIVLYIFAVIGMQVFSKSYTEEIFYPDRIPRWNFTNFAHAVVLVFRILCGEWIEPLWDCMRARGEVCMAVFLPTLVFGNLMVLNLFLALLLNAFASDSMKNTKADTKEDSKTKKGWGKLKNLFKSKKKNAVNPEDETKKSIADIVTELKKNKEEDHEDDEESNGDVPKNKENTPNGHLKGKNSSKGQTLDVISLSSYASSVITRSQHSSFYSSEFEMDENFQTDRSKFNKFKPAVNKNKGASNEDSDDGKTKPKAKENSKDISNNNNDDEENKEPEGIQDCFPACTYVRCPCCMTCQETACGVRWIKMRKAIFMVTEHKGFEWFILFIIFASSITLCFDDIYLYRKPTLKSVLGYLDICFAIIFALEMLMKMVALGWKKYFTTFWYILDFIIVVISLVSIAADQLGLSGLSAFRALRTLRALRPLRAVSRWQGMKIVVNALVSAIPAIFNVLLVCIVFWLIFSIVGVQFFAGKFRKCVDKSTGIRLETSVVKYRNECEAFIDQGFNYEWKNSEVNFDNAIQGYLALLQVATFEGWIEVMKDAVDATNVDEQPEWEANFAAYIYFIVFIIFGSFFTLNLFIGVIIDNFNVLKKKYDGSYVDILLTQNQRNYYNTMKKLGNRKPQKTIKRPKNKVQGFFFDVSMSTKFELAVVILILFNMIAMGVEHYNQSDSHSDALDIMNIIFTTIFTLEALVKIIGMRWHYFRRAWNVFDFLIVILSIIGVVLDDLLRDVFVTPSLLRVVRVFRIGRVLRLIKVAKGIRKLLFAIMISLPALFNIGMLLTLIIFIYAIFFMSLFGRVQLTGALDDVVNFQKFGNSMLLLFRLTTAGGWNEVLEPLMLAKPDCNPDFMTMPDGEVLEVSGGDCGDKGLAIFFMVTFTLLTYLIIINMYIAVILENFSQAHEQEEIGITEDDFEMFYVVWERFDPHATQFIKYDQLSDFVADLDQPLGMPRPNEIALVAFDLPIYDGDRLHCLDILTSLVKHVLGSVEVSDEFIELKKKVEEKYHESFPTRIQQTVRSTTMRRKKEDVAAKTLQRAWRKHRAQQSIRRITEMAMEMKRGKTGFSFTGQRPSIASSSQAPPKTETPVKQDNRPASRAARVRQKSAHSRKMLAPKANAISLPSDNASADINL